MKLCVNLCILIVCFLLLFDCLWAADAVDPIDSGIQNSASDIEDARFGFIQSILGSINENDAKTAIRVWADSMLKELGIPARPLVVTYKDIGQIQRQLEEKQVDILCLSTLQWFALRDLIDEDNLLAVKASGTMKEEYVILVHGSSAAEHIQDLKGKRLRGWVYPRTALSCTWLSSLMAENGLGRAEAFFKKVTWVKKINQAVLPVFFKQSDACLVSLKGLEIMAELNPQIAKQLKIIEKSPPYIPVIFCFRKDYQSRVKPIMLNNLQSMVDSAAGGQLLTIFQMDGLDKVPIAAFANDISLLKDSHVICDPSESVKATGTGD